MTVWESFIRAVDLDHWAERRSCQGEFPELIRRLILATTGDIRRLEFPAHEGVQQEGWDGIVDVGQGNPFVESGLSGWEVSAATDVKRKADRDYDKRVRDPLGIPEGWVGVP